MKTPFLSYKLIACCLAFVLVAGTYFFYIKADGNTYLNMDEVDYAMAAHKGFTANYLGNGALPAKKFIAFCLAKKNKDTAALKQLSLTYNEEADVHLLRHLHPPIPAYYWSFFCHKNPLTETVLLHWSNYPIALLCFLFTLLILVRFYKPSLTQILLALLLLLPAIIAPFFLFSFGQINFHNFELLFAILFCGALLRYARSSSTGRLIVLALAMAALLCTLDMSLIAILPCIVIALLLQKGLFLKKSWVALLQFLFFTLLFVFVLWAGGIIKTTLVRSLFNFFYRIFFHADDEFNKLSALAAWSKLVKENYVVFLIMFVFLGLFIARIKQVSWQCKTLVFTGFIYCLAFTPFLVSSNYLMPGIYMVLFGLTCMVLEDTNLYVYKVKKKNFIVGAVLIIAVAFSLKEMHFGAKKENFIKTETLLNSDYTFIEQHLKNTGNYYAYDYHVINYYCGMQTKRLATFSVAKPDLYMRKNLVYTSLMPAILQHKVDGLIAFKSIHFSDKVTMFIASAGFKKYTLNIYKVWLKE